MSHGRRCKSRGNGRTIGWATAAATALLVTACGDTDGEDPTGTAGTPGRLSVRLRPADGLTFDSATTRVEQVVVAGYDGADPQTTEIGADVDLLQATTLTDIAAGSWCDFSLVLGSAVQVTGSAHVGGDFTLELDPGAIEVSCMVSVDVDDRSLLMMLGHDGWVSADLLLLPGAGSVVVSPTSNPQIYDLLVWELEHSSVYDDVDGDGELDPEDDEVAD